MYELHFTNTCAQRNHRVQAWGLVVCLVHALCGQRWLVWRGFVLLGPQERWSGLCQPCEFACVILLNESYRQRTYVKICIVRRRSAVGRAEQLVDTAVNSTRCACTPLVATLFEAWSGSYPAKVVQRRMVPNFKKSFERAVRTARR